MSWLCRGWQWYKSFGGGRGERRGNSSFMVIQTLFPGRPRVEEEESFLLLNMFLELS